VDAGAAEAAWNDPVWKDRLRQANEQAIAAGVFGAPFFVIDGEPFWGNDRKLQMERWLGQGRSEPCHRRGRKGCETISGYP
jgi:2-hydroxychromene-2-carboxylate isomerase